MEKLLVRIKIHLEVQVHEIDTTTEIYFFPFYF